MKTRTEIFMFEFARRFETCVQDECRRIQQSDYRARVGATMAHGIIAPTVVALIASAKAAWRSKDIDAISGSGPECGSRVIGTH